MKQFIILCSMVTLGLFLYGAIAGSSEDSVQGTLKQVWRQEIQSRTRTP